MADGKDYEIHLKTTGDTTGSQEVEKSLKKVETQAKKASEAEEGLEKAERIPRKQKLTTSGANPDNPFGGQLAAADRQIAEKEALAAAVEKVTDAEQDRLKVQRELDVATAKEIAKEKEHATQAQKTAENIKNIANAQRVQLFGQLANSAAAFGESLKNIGQSAQTSHPQLSKTLETTGGLLSSLGSIGATAATGAAFGPWGIAAGAAIGIGTEAAKLFSKELANDEEKMKAIEQQANAIKQSFVNLAAQTAKNHFNQFIKEANAAATAQDLLNEKIQGQIDLDAKRGQAASNAKVRQLQVAEEQVNLQETSGVITSDQANLERSKIHRQIAEEEKNAEIARENERLKVAQARINAAQAEMDRLQKESVENAQIKENAYSAKKSANRKLEALQNNASEGETDESRQAREALIEKQKQIIAASDTTIKEANANEDKINAKLEENFTEQQRARQNLEKTQEETSIAVDEINQRAENKGQIEALKAAGNNIEQVQQSLQKGTSDLESLATKAVEKGEQIASEQNGKVSETFNRQLDVIKQALADGQIDPNEVQNVINAIQTLNTSFSSSANQLVNGVNGVQIAQKSTSDAQLAAFSEMAGALRTSMSLWNSQSAEIKRMNQQMMQQSRTGQ